MPLTCELTEEEMLKMLSHIDDHYGQLERLFYCIRKFPQFPKRIAILDTGCGDSRFISKEYPGKRAFIDIMLKLDNSQKEVLWHVAMGFLLGINPDMGDNGRGCCGK